MATFCAFWVLAYAARGAYGPSRPPLDPPVPLNDISHKSLCSPLTAMRYSMYFWFCEWRPLLYTTEGMTQDQTWRVCFVQFARWRHRGWRLRLWLYLIFEKKSRSLTMSIMVWNVRNKYATTHLLSCFFFYRYEKDAHFMLWSGLKWSLLWRCRISFNEKNCVAFVGRKYFIQRQEIWQKIRYDTVD